MRQRSFNISRPVKLSTARNHFRSDERKKYNVGMAEVEVEVEEGVAWILRVETSDRLGGASGGERREY